MLHYRSKRRGFTTYTAGQLKAVAQTYFKTEMGIEVMRMMIMMMRMLKIMIILRIMGIIVMRMMRIMIFL